MAAEPLTDELATLASEVREIGLAERRTRAAQRRVAEYLRAYGLADADRLEELATAIVAECASAGGDTPEELPSAAIERAQTRVEAFVEGLFPERGGHVDGMWLRAFVEAHPEHFLGRLESARAAAVRFGDRGSGELPHVRRFVPQQLRPMAWPSWLRGLVPPLAAVAALCAVLLYDLSRDGLSALELALGLCFAWVSLLPAIGLTTALAGWLSRRSSPRTGDPAAELAPTALLVPIYHEDPECVFAAVAAMRESLANSAGGEQFDIFVLSDSRDVSCAADEERAFRRASALAANDCAIALYYRRRANNERYKSGNLAEFFERFGSSYRYAVVLDADSLMHGETLVELVRRMESAPRVGLIQAPLQLHGGATVLARTHQLMASVCGPLFMRGLAHWSGPHGNYYGHNAILRIDAFMECCALPALPGIPPLGGHFLSHDFVEAALLCRAGWEVRTAWDLTGSWEQMPQTLSEYAARDRRWCQGNMQHLRIVLAEGLRAMSRIHLLIGALSYLSGPALFAFLAVGAAALALGSELSPGVAATLLGAAVACLGLPRLLGVLDVARDRRRRAEHGGAVRLLLSVAAETLLSSLLAPLLMFHHARAVAAVATGRAVRWTAQSRGAAGSLGAIAQRELPSTLFGFALGGTLLAVAPTAALWLAPCWVPLALAVPLSALASSTALGALFRRAGLFMTPPELTHDPLLERAAELRALTAADDAARFRDLVLDPLLLAAHLERLTGSSPVSADLTVICERALRLGPAGLSPAERALLQADAHSMRRLHREAWRRWPVESWQVATSGARLPRCARAG